MKTTNEQGSWSFLGGGGAEVHFSISLRGPFPVLTACPFLVERL